MFCDEGFFTTEETDLILKSAATYGMKPKIHANEMANSGGVQIGIANNAVSVDHLERIETEEIDALLSSITMPVALPGASFFLRIPYAPVRKMIDSGLPVVLASDFNPGSSPGGNMQFIMSLVVFMAACCPKRHCMPLPLMALLPWKCKTNTEVFAPAKLQI